MEKQQITNELWALIGHDLRTPLNVIIGYSELIQEECEDKEEAVNWKQFLKKINDSGQYILSLFDIILELSNIETNSIELQPESFSLYTLLIESKEFCRLYLEEQNVDLEIKMKKKLTHEIKADFNRIHQALTSLITYVICFVTQGPVQMIANVNNHQIELCLKAEKYNIPQDQLIQLFKTPLKTPSQDIEVDIWKRLKLVISQKIVKLMGGSMNVTNENNQLSFHFQFDYESSDVEDLGAPEIGQPYKSLMKATEGENFDISSIPQSLRQQMVHLAITGDLNTLKSLLKEVSNYNEKLANHLNQLINNFDLTKIQVCLKCN